MLKAVGALLVVLSCGAMGYGKSLSYTKRQRELEEIQKMLYFLLGEIDPHFSGSFLFRLALGGNLPFAPQRRICKPGISEWSMDSYIWQRLCFNPDFTIQAEKKSRHGIPCLHYSLRFSGIYDISGPGNNIRRHKMVGLQ